MAQSGAGDGWQVVLAPWHLDEHMPGFPVPAGQYELVLGQLAADSQLDRVIGLHEVAAGLVARAVRPLLLSGDCVMALGAMAGLQRRHGDVAVVWLDAHGDFNTPATTITGYLGGMPLAMLTGRGRELISDGLGLRPVADHQVVLVDARDLDPAEREALAASGVRHVPADPDAVAGALGPSPSRTSSPTAPLLSGASTKTSADGSAASAAASGEPSADWVAGRAAATTAIGSSSRRRPR